MGCWTRSQASGGSKRISRLSKATRKGWLYLDQELGRPVLACWPCPTIQKVKSICNRQLDIEQCYQNIFGNQYLTKMEHCEIKLEMKAHSEICKVAFVKCKFAIVISYITISCNYEIKCQWRKRKSQLWGVRYSHSIITIERYLCYISAHWELLDISARWEHLFWNLVNFPLI